MLCSLHSAEFPFSTLIQVSSCPDVSAICLLFLFVDLSYGWVYLLYEKRQWIELCINIIVSYWYCKDYISTQIILTVFPWQQAAGLMDVYMILKKKWLKKKIKTHKVLWAHHEKRCTMLYLCKYVNLKAIKWHVLL